MAHGKISTQQELMDLFLDPSQFKSLAAELAQTSGPPDFGDFNIESLKAQMGGAGAGAVLGAGDIDASSVTTLGAAGQQSNVQATENAAQGVPGAPGVDLAGIGQGLGGAADVLRKARGGGPQPPAPQNVGSEIDSLIRELPGPTGDTATQSLVALLSRR